MFGYTEPREGRGRGGPRLVSWPPTRPFLLAGLVALALLVAMVQVGVFSYVFARLGISPGAALILLLGSLIGSAVNVPVARFRNQLVQVRGTASAFGVRYIVPVLTRRSTTIAVNAGGALVPAAVSVYLIVHDRIGWQALVAVVVVGALVHLVARPVPGLGIAVPAPLPGLSIGGAGTFDGVFITGIIAVLLASLL